MPTVAQCCKAAADPSSDAGVSGASSDRRAKEPCTTNVERQIVPVAIIYTMKSVHIFHS